jgi:hypothetical protein
MSRGRRKNRAIFGLENTVSVSLQGFAGIKERYDSYGDDIFTIIAFTFQTLQLV